MDEEQIKRILLISGLKNAVEFEGKPNKKAIIGKLMSEMPEMKAHIKNILPIADKIIQKILDLSLEKQKEMLLELDSTALDKKDKKEEEKELPELPNYKNYKKIIMRLAPYPSGALHIGNARMVILNDEYVKQYQGELILFYDDTIGSPKSLRDSPKAKYVLPEAYNLIKDGLNWLDVKISKIYYKSDRLEIYYEYCEKLIKEGIAYVCFCSADEFREKYKNQKKDCPHRNNSMEKNFDEWRNMLGRKYKETEAVVRLKTGMDQDNPALRDQIIMRISEAEHPRVGNKYILWPMLEYSWAIDDHLLGVTHILRGIDLVKEDIIEQFIWEHFKWYIAEFMHYGRINFPDIKLSKSKSRNNIKAGKYQGWEDPRTWSLQSLQMRGIRPEALRKSLLDLGMSTTSINFDVRILYAKNKDIIDEISYRYFFVEDPFLIEINEIPFENIIAEPLLLPSNPKKGHRTIKCNIINKSLELLIASNDVKNFKIDDILRFKDLVNIKIRDIDRKNKIVKCKYHSKELNREYSIIQWVPKEDNIRVSVIKPDGSISNGYGEINLLEIPMRETIQFERYGFVNPIKIESKELICYFTHY
ncbi:MAG: glutamate--tRNA ligase [Candidatus Heimdallarchaeota archaeon]